MGSQTSNINRHSNRCLETKESKKGGDQDDDDDDEDDDIKMKKKQTKIEQWTIRQQVEVKRWPPEYKTSAKKSMFPVDQLSSSQQQCDPIDRCFFVDQFKQVHII